MSSNFLLLRQFCMYCFAVPLGKKKKKSGSRQRVLGIILGDLSQSEFLFSLQRPVRWTMAAAIAPAMTRWRASAAAVLLASLCSRTARPVKVRHISRHSGPRLPSTCSPVDRWIQGWLWQNFVDFFFLLNFFFLLFFQPPGGSSRYRGFQLCFCFCLYTRDCIKVRDPETVGWYKWRPC